MIRKIAFFILCLLFATPSWAENVSQEKEPIKIGVLLPFTGYKEGAFASRNAFDIAVDEVNKNGGVLGRKLKLVYRDDKGNPNDAVKAAEDLVLNNDVRIIVGTIHDHVKLAVSNFSRKNNVLFLCTSGGSDTFIFEQKHDLAYRLDLPNYVYVQALAEAAAKLPAKKWAAIAPNYEYGVTFIKDFKKYLIALRPDIEFVYEQFSPTLDLNAGPTVQAISVKNPDAIVTGLFGSDAVKFIREGNKRDLFTNRFVVSALSGMPEEMNVTGKETPKGWITLGYPYDEIKSPEHVKFVSSYKKMFQEPPLYSSLYTFIGVQVLEQAINRAQSDMPTDISKALKGGTFKTLLGEMTFSQETNQLNGGVWLGKTAIVDGQPKLIDWVYKPGDKYYPGDTFVKTVRPNSPAKKGE